MTKTQHNIKTSPLPNVIKGSADWREFRPLLLSNGITCLLVNDKESKTTACSVSVGVGASADPRQLSGLAHFTEHMCFLGSEAYPQENEFKSYLSAHGGRSNASTSMSQTCYKFDVLAEHAEKVIDIFANFFVAPLFTQSGTNREVNAVDSENSKNESADGRRRLQILKALADKNHHYSKFSTGNAKTLPAMDDEKAPFVREALLAFHKRHYRPDNMTVVVVGPQSLDVLEEWVVPRFAKIQSRIVDKSPEEMTEAEKLVEDSAGDIPDDSFGSPAVPYNPAFKPEIHGQWPVLLTTNPLQSLRKLYLYFPLPSTRELGDQSPYSLICHLLGHEGKGSCFAVLQDAELVDSLSVGPRLADSDQSLLQIDISLTEKGEEHWRDVVATIFEYCRMLEGIGKNAKEGNENDYAVLERIWDEICTIRKLNFHQNSPNNAYSFAPSVANSVRKNGTEKCLSLGRLLNETKDSIPLDHFFDFLQGIDPENCMIERCSKSAWEESQQMGKKEMGDESIFGFQNEKWYGVKYHLHMIPLPDVKYWKEGGVVTSVESANLGLPTENRFVPRDLSLCPDLPEEAKKGPCISKEMEPPRLIITNDFGRLWHRLDDRYCLPKSSLSILLRTPCAENVFDESSNEWKYDTTASMHSAILMDAFSDALTQETYDAELAGLHWRLSKVPSGFILRCSGYSEHLTDFALQLLSRFFADHSFLQEKHVAINKDRYLRNLLCYFESKRADSYAAYYTDFLLHSRGRGVDHTIEVTENVSLSTLEDHFKRLLSSRLQVDCLFAGNVSEEESRRLFSGTQDIIGGAQRSAGATSTGNIYTTGSFERKLEDGKEVHLHFQSKNTEEQNGAVLMTFQSATSSFKGCKLSKPESLVQSAAVRTICHMLREPLFNQLRTKEQLGYIVSSYYEKSASLHFDMSAENSALGTQTTSIDSIVINVLSKKVPPPIVRKRIDDFLSTFRVKLENLSVKEIESHKNALSKGLLKPKQKLGDEAQVQLTKIKDYAPEVLGKGLGPEELPWHSTKELAGAIQGLNRADLINTWENIIAGKRRSRIVSHVYGSSFPLSKQYTGDFEMRNRNNSIETLKSLEDIKTKRDSLRQYTDNNNNYRAQRGIFSQLLNKKVVTAFGLGLGLGVYALCRKNSSESTKSKE